MSNLKQSKWMLVAVVGLTALAGQARASLIFTGVISSTGNGIGAVNTSVTFQNSPSESGCVGFNGGTLTTGAGACTSGFIGGDEKPGASQTNVFTAAQLGFTATNNFSNLLLIFNGNEGGGLDQSITLNSLGLTLFSSSGTLLATFTSPSLPRTFTAFPGVGNAGFGFALDAAQAAQANTLLASNPLPRIGTEANASASSAGPETIQLTTVTSTSAVPEPATVTMLSSGLLFIGASLLRKRSLGKS